MAINITTSLLLLHLILNISSCQFQNILIEIMLNIVYTEYHDLTCFIAVYLQGDLLVTFRITLQGPLLLTWFNFNPSMDK